MFKINDIDLSTYKVIVERCEGVFDFPARIQPTEYSWNDEDGVEAFVKAEDIHFVQRVITLACFMNTSDIYEFQTFISELRELVYGQFSLTTPYGTFECIMKNGASVEPIQSQQSGKFRFRLEFHELASQYGIPPVGTDSDTDVFTLDKVNLLSAFGILVEECTGHFDFTRMKTDNLTRYKRESDQVNFREARDIRLKCSLISKSLNDFSTKIQSFKNLLASEGLKELRIPGVLSALNVYSRDGFQLTDLIRNDNQIIGRFDITLRESRPEIESIAVYVLLDTDGIPILTNDGKYIYITYDKKLNRGERLYLYLNSEGQPKTNLYTEAENQENVFLYNDSEL